MNIIVCIKQVPGAAKVEIDPVTGVMKRDTAEAKLNPYDLYAVEEALKLSEAVGGGVTALSMGPPQAREALSEALYMGADQAVLLSDRGFAGSDVLATAYALSQAAEMLGFDIIICGKQTTDGDTAQVGAELAEFLGIPHAANVLTIHAVDGSDAGAAGTNGRAVAGVVGTGGIGVSELQTLPEGRGLIITVGQENRILTQYIPTPCLLCVDGGVNTPRLPSYKRKRALDAGAVRILSLADMGDKNDKNYGLNGSPTQVERTYTPDDSVNREIITGGGDHIAASLAKILGDMKYI